MTCLNQLWIPDKPLSKRQFQPYENPVHINGENIQTNINNTMFFILDLSLSAFLSLSLLLLPHRTPQNLFLLHSSFWALFVSRSNVLTLVMLISFSSSHFFLTLVTAVFSFFFTTLVFSSSAFKACTSSLSSGISASFPLILF